MLRQKQNSYTPNNQYYIFQKSAFGIVPAHWDKLTFVA